MARKRMARGAAALECALGLPLLLAAILCVVQVAFVCATQLVAAYAAYMAARAAGVQRAEDRLTVAWLESQRILGRLAVAAPHIAGQRLTVQYALPWPAVEGRAGLPFVAFPRRPAAGAPEGDNPLP
ncbi:MAG: pilus assembly protein [Deltaproteobacteria bacterium]|nr:pilus assembly protein [Deltaproteobacteria bacterium]